MSLNCWWMILQRLMAYKTETRRSFTMSGQIHWRFLNDSRCFPFEVLLDHRNDPSNDRCQWIVGPKTSISRVKFLLRQQWNKECVGRKELLGYTESLVRFFLRRTLCPTLAELMGILFVPLQTFPCRCSRDMPGSYAHHVSGAYRVQIVRIHRDQRRRIYSHNIQSVYLNQLHQLQKKLSQCVQSYVQSCLEEMLWLSRNGQVYSLVSSE